MSALKSRKGQLSCNFHRIVCCKTSIVIVEAGMFTPLKAVLVANNDF
jgi:hypothetical protein